MENKYLSEVIADKIKYYSKYAHLNRICYMGVQSAIVVLAALTPILAALEGKTIIEGNGEELKFTLISSTILAVLEGISRLFRFKNLWLRYRSTSNNLKNEVRQFENQTGKYHESENPLGTFISTCEGIIEKEQIAWYNSLNKE